MQKAAAQVEVAPWGNLTGIRTDGQLLEFATSLRLVKVDGHVTETGKERQRPKYTRAGNQQLITTQLDSLDFVETVQDTGPGQARVQVQLTARNSMPDSSGAYFSVQPPTAVYPASSAVEVRDARGTVLATGTLASLNLPNTPASSIRLVAPTRQLTITFGEPMPVQLKQERGREGPYYRFYLPLLTGSAQRGQTTQKTFTFQATGSIDQSPINLTLNPAQPGRPFAGFGGNFRLQNPKTDPQVIDYSLQNMRVAWSRVEMPWQLWQPLQDQDPTAAARQGKLHPHVRESMEMAQKLSKQGIPIILSAWSAPAWAVVGTPARGSGPGPDGKWGNPLEPSKLPASYKSIADYIQYLKDQYAVDVALFSFNESDLGINIRQTGQEHAQLIKELGAYFASRGLKTKLLLGDNSDANSYEFMTPALQDASTHPYIGAVSFHSWRGWETETLQKWAAAAEQLRLPLIVGEGSIDAQAWGYPAIFLEPTYALEEISLYMRLLAVCQPFTILQWQLTADYSPMAGGGIFGDNTPLRPTQRFWNLKQFASTPENVMALPITADRPDVAAAALGNNQKGTYVVHLVNNGATRRATLTGVPATVKKLRVYTTDQARAMQKGKPVKVKKGTAQFALEAGTYTTLMTK
ncbi:hypothetical protein [Hymenobacter volaticus]|uniref:Uncharacterized protein n=1 Tax=Hymenobacter volaticus TaxID=2932254 RepID=A0ABY4GE50_9BACT|nr:hypothetical protein [Hymenobacter volaticus]UOQ69122.1 hypothetical protein MUN86_25745 [Hymenobacter volaticus]